MKTACKYSCLISCVAAVLSGSAWAERATFSLKLAGYLPKDGLGNGYSSCWLAEGYGTGAPCTSHGDCTVDDEYCRHTFRAISCGTDDIPPIPDDTKCPGDSECVYTVLVPSDAGEPIWDFRCASIDPVPIGMVQPGDTVFVEIQLSGWDPSPDSGVCDDGTKPCSVADQDCPNKHCANNNVVCVSNIGCDAHVLCVPDVCNIYPRVGAYQWKVDSSTYYNDHGPLSNVSPAELPCSTMGGADLVCSHGYTESTECTSVPGECFDGLCLEAALAYLASIRADYLFKRFDATDNCDQSSEDYACGGIVLPPGVLDDGTPKYAGTLVLDISEDACGSFQLGLLPDGPGSTFVRDAKGIPLQDSIVNPLDLQLSIEPSCFPPCGGDDLCKTYFCGCSHACEDTPKECPEGEVCNPLTGMCGPPGDDCPAGMAFDPDQMDIDAGQPKAIDGGARQGYQTFKATGTAGADASCWTMTETDAGGCGDPALTVVEDPAGKYEITLAQPLQPGADTDITYQPDSGDPVTGTFTALPGDVDGSRETDVDDLLALIDCLTNWTCEDWECDIDRLEDCTGADLERLVDLLNGAGAYDSWDGETPAGTPCS